MATDTGYAKGDYLRICDICLHRFHMSDLRPIGELRYACKDDAPGLTAIQISRWNARARPLKIRPNKWAKGLTQTPTYQLPEAQIFNFISTTAPAQSPDGSPAPLAAAWAAIYMADVINDGRRPSAWLARARTVLQTCLSYLLTLQYTTAAANPRYGGILSGSTYPTTTTLAAGLAFIKGYAALGTASYLQAAERVATFVRHVQCGHLQVTKFTVYPQSGGAYHVRGLASGVVDATGLLTNAYLTADIAGLWFLNELSAVLGPATAFGDAAATAFFSAATSATLDTMMSELGAFASSGAKDSAAAGAPVLGLSTTAPRATYVAARDGEADAGGWTTISTISSDDIALAIRGLYEVSPVNAQVTSLMAWLAAFGANSANATPVQPESLTLVGITGTYDPVIAPADNLKAAAPFTEATGALYSWASLGLLSPILSATTRTTFKSSKDALSKTRRFAPGDMTEKYLGPLGLSGLDYQPRTGGGLSAADVVRAAKAGQAYRQDPGIYPQVALF